MTDYGQPLRFGFFPSPRADNLDNLLRMVEIAEDRGLDLVSIQDHPYQKRFLDTWTLLSVVGARSSSIRLSPNVANLPLRPPVMLAKAAASLDVITEAESNSASVPGRSGTAWSPPGDRGGRRARRCAP